LEVTAFVNNAFDKRYALGSATDIGLQRRHRRPRFNVDRPRDAFRYYGLRVDSEILIGRRPGAAIAPPVPIARRHLAALRREGAISSRLAARRSGSAPLPPAPR